jgi:hypothetical protein
MTRTPSVQRAVARPLGRQECHCTSVRSSDEPMSLLRCSEPKSHWRSASERHVHSVTNSHATTSLWGVVGPRKHLTQSRGGQIRLTGDRAQRAEPTGDPLLPKPMTGARWRWWAPESALLPFPCVRQRRWTRVGAGTVAGTVGPPASQPGPSTLSRVEDVPPLPRRPVAPAWMRLRNGR